MGMVLFLVFVGVLLVLVVAALLGATPDTHREVSQHGNFEF